MNKTIKSPLNKKNGKYFPRAFGYREYESFLGQVGTKSPWAKLHNLDGQIKEISHPNYSVFYLDSKNPLDHDKNGMQIILTDVDLDKAANHQLVRLSDWRVRKAIVQRIYYLSLCNSVARLNFLKGVESKYK